ncbi:MAG: ribonuclease [Candidatus Atribacteria bacterium]|nr:ribonuclease [Candidatus Atribacteria bacterium]
MIEEFLWERGYSFIGGVDEAGRGPLAGPLVAACVVLPRYCYLPGVKDSKSLSPSRRKELYKEICSSTWAIGIGMVGEKFIDAVGIEKANAFVFQEAICRASSSYFPDFLVLDWVKIPYLQTSSLSFARAESKSLAVAAASVVAKVFRDEIMENFYQPLFPHFSFSQHKGYGTSLHRKEIEKWGLESCHRLSFCRKYGKPS